MRKHSVKLCFIGLFSAVVAQAAHENLKPPAMSGSIEGGFGYSVTAGATRGSQMFVDQLHLKHHFDVSDKTKVDFHNVFSLNGPNAGPGGYQNGASFFSGATLTGGGFAMSNFQATLSHEWAKGVSTVFGHMPTPFGMEGMWDRVDMWNYFYSAGYQTAQAMGWNYDYGLKLQLKDVVPGTLEFMVNDGRRNGGATTILAKLSPVVPAAAVGAIGAVPANDFQLGAALRWHNEIKTGDLTIMPVLSAYLSQFSGTKDYGINGGAVVKSGTFWVNGELYYFGLAQTNTALEAVKVLTVNVEPGIDLGVVDLSLKYNYYNVSVNPAAGVSDHALGGAIGKTYDDKYNVKVAYMHTNLSGKVGAHVNDFRLLMSAKW